MKADTQAVHLEKLMQEKKSLSSYKLALPFYKIMRSDIKTLSQNSIVLLGLKSLECVLLSDENTITKLKRLKSTSTLDFEIMTTSKIVPLKDDVEKYARVSCILKSIEIASLNLKTMITIEDIDFMHVEVYFDGVPQAEGKLVSVNDEIAIEITKVTKDEI